MTGQVTAAAAVAPVSRAVHAHSVPGLQALSVWTERRPGLGEDADPLVLHHLPSTSGVLAVFDGAGGAGSASAWQNALGTARTGAWTGSRAARLGVETWFHDGVLADARPEPAALEDQLRRILAAARPEVRSKLVGTMRRQLPTTLAAIRYRWSPQGIASEALWAGDSRAYVLTPSDGLQVLSRDHTEETDALTQLIQDPPMTNMVCADRPFRVESNTHHLTSPGLYLCATDGFFGYVNTPSDFEHLLLTTLSRSADAQAWAVDLARVVQGYSADDASLALVAIGFDSFHRLKEQFEPRLHAFLADYAGMPDPSDQDAVREWRHLQWCRYRETYEQYLPELREEDE